MWVKKRECLGTAEAVMDTIGGGIVHFVIPLHVKLVIASSNTVGAGNPSPAGVFHSRAQAMQKERVRSGIKSDRRSFSSICN